MERFDVVVIGGGPAGLAASIAAARVGLSVLVADVHQPPIDKLCGEGLLPDALEASLPSTVIANGVALIGEASGSVDAITGDGLSLVFREALALGEALRLGDLRHYQRAQESVLRRSRWMARVLLSLSEFPTWRSRVFQTLAAEPRAFQNLLGMHVGGRPKVLARADVAAWSPSYSSADIR